MATRHRIPTIFNLSMVDVLCCALGCVILLWLLNLREAKQQTEAAGHSSQLLAESDQHLRDVSARLQATADERERLARLAADTEKERDTLREGLAAARARLTDLDKTVATLRQQYADAQDRLARKVKEQDTLAKELAAVRKQASEAEMLVREKEGQARTAARNADNLMERLLDLDARLKKARAEADLVPELRDKLAAAEAGRAALQKDIEVRTRDLAAAGKKIQDEGDAQRRLEQEVAALNRQLADANRSAAALRDDKRALTEQVSRARADAENRFAGIALTGKRVVFLVDMSGSMELVDDNTPAPDKWVGVRQTLAKIMKSLPDLEKFQVILFSNQVSFPLGKDGQWLDFDRVTSTGQAAEALARTKPRGNTNMYAGFEAAFRYRSQGLDTVYFLSDGLPNIGAGLDPEAARRLTETERGEILGKHIRRVLKTQWNPSQPGRPRVRINAIGFFYESPDVGAFLWALARENDGSFVGMSKP
jgi:hypothetical protein